MKYLSLEQLVALQVLVVNESGGSQGVRDLERLKSVIANPQQEVFGEALYPTVYEKAAVYLRNIIADHAFIDGNKRTGILAALTFLQMNGVNFRAMAGELENFAVQVATEHLDVPVIAAWLKSHSKKAASS